MSKLIMMRGLPAAGKSTKCEEIIASGGEYYRVNRDLLRKMLHNDIFTHQREKVTINMQQVLVIRLLSEGKNVIVDDTNLGEKHETFWRVIATTCDAKFEVIDMMETVTYEECLDRNYARPNKVPDGVIENMALQYGYTVADKIVVCDIDGTVAEITHRLGYARGEKKDWKKFFSLVSKDVPRAEVYESVRKLAEAHNAGIVFVSARPEDYRLETEQWLRTHNMYYSNLIMRRKGDKRQDTDVKSDIYNRYLRQYDIVRVFDDRPSVIRMWREKGLEVEDVGNGIEF
jgi:predicted kinase